MTLLATLWFGSKAEGSLTEEYHVLCHVTSDHKNINKKKKTAAGMTIFELTAEISKRIYSQPPQFLREDDNVMNNKKSESSADEIHGSNTASPCTVRPSSVSTVTGVGSV